MAELAERYLILSQTLSAIAEATRVSKSYTFDIMGACEPGGSLYRLTEDDLSIQYYEVIDAERPEEACDLTHSDRGPAAANPWYLGFDLNNEGKLVPVLYEIVLLPNELEKCLIDRHFYLGSAMINQHRYDKWRVIEEIPPQTDGYGFTSWESSRIKYIYTEPLIVEGQEPEKQAPQAFADDIKTAYELCFKAGMEAGKMIAMAKEGSL